MFDNSISIRLATHLSSIIMFRVNVLILIYYNYCFISSYNYFAVLFRISSFSTWNWLIFDFSSFFIISGFSKSFVVCCNPSSVFLVVSRSITIRVQNLNCSIHHILNYTSFSSDNSFDLDLRGAKRNFIWVYFILVFYFLLLTKNLYNITYIVLYLKKKVTIFEFYHLARI